MRHRAPVRAATSPAQGLAEMGEAAGGTDVADQRHRDIRLLLGRHVYGSSDPAFWTRKILRDVRPPQQSFCHATFAAAVPALLAEGDLERAMFAARLSTALESRRAGEELTDRILREPKVKAALERIRPDPALRSEILPPSEWQPAFLFGVAS